MGYLLIFISLFIFLFVMRLEKKLETTGVTTVPLLWSSNSARMILFLSWKVLFIFGSYLVWIHDGSVAAIKIMFVFLFIFPGSWLFVFIIWLFKLFSPKK